MNDSKSRDIFYGVIAIATLIVALIGATLAYFSMSVGSEEAAVNARAATLSIEYKDGKEVLAQATKLIPAAFSVVSKVYERSIDDINADYNDAETSVYEKPNRCLDDNNMEVCSIYRFSISSDAPRSISAILNTEFNGFKYLAYAVRDVNAGTWLTLRGDDDSSRKYIDLKSCDNANEENMCFTDVNDIKTYDSVAINSILGYTNTNDFSQKRIEEDVQVYDLVLFINDNNDNQNIDQGKQFQGTINVRVVDEVYGDRVYGVAE